MPDQPIPVNLDEQLDDTIKRPSWRRRLLVLGLIALVLVGGWAASIWYRGAPHRQLEISRETTAITEPLTADGQVNYVAAAEKLMSEGVTPETNAVVPLMRAFGPGDIPRDQAARFFERLGMERLPVEGEYLTGYSDLMSRAAVDAPEPLTSDDVLSRFEEATSRPWRPQEFPWLDDWLDDNRAALGTVVSASQRKGYYQPLILQRRPYFMNSLVLVDRVNWSCWALLARAMRSVDAGELESAWTDIHAVWRLSSIVAQSLIIADRIIAEEFDKRVSSHKRLPRFTGVE